jgi:hypothetical protein
VSEPEPAEGRVVSLTSADLVVAVLAVQRGLVDEAGLDRFVDLVLTRRGEGKDTSFLGELLQAEAATEDDVRVLKLLRKEQGRRCQACQATTFLLPDQTEANTPCERCGGALLPRQEQVAGVEEPEDEVDEALGVVEEVFGGPERQAARWIDQGWAKLLLAAALVGALLLVGLAAQPDPVSDLVLPDPPPGTYRAVLWRVAGYDADGVLVELGAADVPNPDVVVTARLSYSLLVARGGAVEQLVKELYLRQAARNEPPPADLEVERVILAEGGELRFPWLPKLRRPPLRTSALPTPRPVTVALGDRTQSKEGLSLAHVPAIVGLEDR